MRRTLLISLLLLGCVPLLSFSRTIVTPVIISSAETIPDYDSWTVSTGGSITISAGGSLTVYGQLSTIAGRPITVNSGGSLIIADLGNFDHRGILTIQYGGSFQTTIDAIVNIVSGSTISCSGSATIRNGFVLNSGSTMNINGSGTVTVLSDGTLVVDDGATFNNTAYGILYLNGGNATIEGTMTIGGSAIVSVSGTLSIVLNGSLSINSGGTVTVNSGGTLNNSDDVTVHTGGIVNINSGGVCNVENGGTTTVYGTLTVNSGGTMTIKSGGITAPMNGGIFDVYGILTIKAGGYTLVYDLSFLNVRPGGKVIQETGLAIVTVYEGGTMHLMSSATDHAEVTLNERSIIRFFDDTGTIIIDEGSFINVNANSQIANLTWSSGVIECYEARPFRGTGNLHRILVNFHNNFKVAAGDIIVFKYGGDLHFDCPAQYGITVDGYLEFRGFTGSESMTFSGCPSFINVNDGATLNFNALGPVGSLPAITGQTSSTISFIGMDTARMYVDFQPGSRLYTLGSFTSDYATFHGPQFPGWYGIKVEGASSSIVMDRSAILNAGSYNYYALEVYNTTNPANAIRRSEILTPLNPTANAGKGIWVHGTGTHLSINCVLVHGFETGIHNQYGDIDMSGSKMNGNYVGFQSESGTVDVLYTCIIGNLDRGLVLYGASVGTGFNMSYSRIVENTNAQVEFYGAGTPNITNCEIFYEPGNTTTCLVNAYSATTANMESNWWGVYPTTAMMFNAIAPAIINHLNEYMVDPDIECMCIYWPKEMQEVSVVPEHMSLRNYPNPFNPSTVIEYTLPTESPVLLKVYSITGEAIATLVDKTEYAGTHRTTFTAPKTCVSGVYLYELTTNEGTIQGRMILTK